MSPPAPSYELYNSDSIYPTRAQHVFHINLRVTNARFSSQLFNAYFDTYVWLSMSLLLELRIDTFSCTLYVVILLYKILVSIS